MIFSIIYLRKAGSQKRKKVQGTDNFSVIDASLIAKEYYNKYLHFKKIVPNLKKRTKEKTEVNVLFGKKAIETLVTNALREKGEIVLLGRGGYLIEQLGEAKHQYISKLKELDWKMIQTKDYKNKEFKPKEIRYLPEGSNIDTAFLTFSNKVYLFSKQKEIFIIEITDKSFANTFKTYFELFWNIASSK